jgi:hypothetical protein
MSLAVRALATLVILTGVAAPLIAAVASGVIASMSPAIGHGKIIRSIRLCSTLNIVGMACSLTLILLIPMPLAQWAFATIVALIAGMIGSCVNLVNAMQRLNAPADDEDATVHQTSETSSGAHS